MINLIIINKLQKGLSLIELMIAMAIACEPKLLICDEPTTALDVTIQKQVLDLMQELQDEYDMGMLFITHDFGVVADIADDVVVMYQGKIVEQGDVDSVNDSCQAFQTNRNHGKKGNKKVKVQDNKLGRQDFDAHSEMNVREIRNR